MDLVIHSVFIVNTNRIEAKKLFVERVREGLVTPRI